MTVGTYLTQRAAQAVLSTTEKASIQTSIVTIQSRLNSYFGTKVSEHFKFGSFTRDTILPRSMDTQSDIDYMVVFADTDKSPQTYLDRLKAFANTYYSTSDIKQSHPTIVLELNHIRFELVPAIYTFFGYQIPNDTGSWQSTSPNDFNSKLTERNKSCYFMLKPAIRLIKYWNAKRGYVFDSYPLETVLADKWYMGCVDLKDHLFDGILGLQLHWMDAQWRRDELQRAKDIVNETSANLRLGYPVSAEASIKKLIPAA